MIELTEEQRQKLETGDPIEVADSQTRQPYVLLRKDVFERIKAILDRDWVDAAYPAAMEVFAREGWDDPRMDVYDTLDPRRLS